MWRASLMGECGLSFLGQIFFLLFRLNAHRFGSFFSPSTFLLNLPLKLGFEGLENFKPTAASADAEPILAPIVTFRPSRSVHQRT
jgi:hypothetical protein